jgi:hypothetical protein
MCLYLVEPEWSVEWIRHAGIPSYDRLSEDEGVETRTYGRISLALVTLVTSRLSILTPNLVKLVTNASLSSTVIPR